MSWFRQPNLEAEPVNQVTDLTCMQVVFMLKMNIQITRDIDLH